jgi:hypothetical protein
MPLGRISIPGSDKSLLPGGGIVLSPGNDTAKAVCIVIDSCPNKTVITRSLISTATDYSRSCAAGGVCPTASDAAPHALGKVVDTSSDKGGITGGLMSQSSCDHRCDAGGGVSHATSNDSLCPCCVVFSANHCAEVAINQVTVASANDTVRCYYQVILATPDKPKLAGRAIVDSTDHDGSGIGSLIASEIVLPAEYCAIQGVDSILLPAGDDRAVTLCMISQSPTDKGILVICRVCGPADYCAPNTVRGVVHAATDEALPAYGVIANTAGNS